MKNVALIPNSADAWTERFAIRSYQLDANGKLSLPALCNFMQEAAGNHAAALNVSLSDLRAAHQTWMLSRMTVALQAYPGRGETLTVVTWPSGGHRLFALRNFSFSDAADRQIGHAVTAWLVVDLATRRPVRIEPVLQKLRPAHVDPGAPTLIDALGSLPLCASYPLSCNTAVRFSDLDANQHVNNVRFIQWALDSLPPETLQRYLLEKIEISFVGEAFYGDRVTAASSRLLPHQPTCHHRIFRATDNQELARVRTLWRPLP